MTFDNRAEEIDNRDTNIGPAPVPDAWNETDLMPVIDIAELRRHLLPATRLMGLDLGQKTIGIAVSDDQLAIALPLKTLQRTRFRADMESLRSLLSEYRIGGIIIGLPLNMDGSEGPRCQSARQFGTNLLKHVDLPLSYWDERLSTMAMERHLIAEDVSRKRRSKIIDKLAAQFILQGALDRMQNPDLRTTSC